MKLRSSTLLLILQAGIALFGQSVTRAGQPRRFHVQGTISGPADFIELRVVPGIEVRFQSGQSSKIVEADSRGFYQADLPFGLYTMTAQAPKMGAQGIDYFTKYVRPLFRVTSPTVLILNGTLHMARLTCDIVLASDSPELQREESKNSCGGEDSFPVPSEDAIPFQLYVRYAKRQPTQRGYIFSSDRISEPDVPVFVAYNLFSLQADKVVYDTKKRTIQASGNILITGQTGSTERADSMTFKIGNGRAIAVR
jgi:hypothetical protein